MSSAGQPENNDLTRRQGFEVRVRHPAGGASLRQLLRAARRDRLRLSRSQRHVLAAIQNELQADADLTAAFSAFTSVTLGAAMPKAERVSARSTLACWRRCYRAFLSWRIMLVVAAVAALAAAGLALALTAFIAGRADSLRSCLCSLPHVMDRPGRRRRGRAASGVFPAAAYGRR